jgi:hypothetical protein
MKTAKLYRDISPVSVIPKLVSIVQVITGWIYIVFIIAFTISAVSRKGEIAPSKRQKFETRKTRDILDPKA